MHYYIIEGIFPFIDNNKNKKRPVVVISRPRTKYNSIVCGFVTSKIPEELLDTDLIIEPNEHNSLVKTSVIRLHKLTILEQESQGEIIGQLAELQSAQIQIKLKSLFNL